MENEHGYEPPLWLKNPHVHTFINSKIRKPWLQLRTANFEAEATQHIVSLGDGTRLKAITNLKKFPAPTIVILAGLFGGYRSGYVLSAATYLWDAGFSIVRLMLKDHGDTADLNSEVFSAANINEVREAVACINNHIATGELGVLGYSLGGNITLRLNELTGIRSLAVCPVLNPAASVARVDQNWFYRRFFISKWRRIIRQKLVAYPDKAGLAEALELNSLTDLTRHFAVSYSNFRNIEEYFDNYTLNRDRLRHCTTTTLYALDDPVVPSTDYQRVLSPQRSVCSRYGGHCAFLQNNFASSWIDWYAERYFQTLKCQAAPLIL